MFLVPPTASSGHDRRAERSTIGSQTRGGVRHALRPAGGVLALAVLLASSGLLHPQTAALGAMEFLPPAIHGRRKETHPAAARGCSPERHCTMPVAPAPTPAVNTPRAGLICQ